ncbi:DUF87 domain-containing protein [Vibrio vulnificus]|nr:DUF87 domain-containing protein [Vibrio vulnificus]
MGGTEGLPDVINKAGSDEDLVSHFGFVVAKKENSIDNFEFTIEGNPQLIEELSNAKLKKLDNILYLLNDYFVGEEDSYVRKAISKIIAKCENKKHLSYEEYLSGFDKVNYLDFNREYDRLSDLSKREEQNYKHLHSYYDRVKYESPYGKDINELNNKMYELEKFNYSNKPTPEGYLNYIQKNYPREAYSFYTKPLLAKIPLGERKKHTYVVAQTGSGKSELLKVLAWGDIEAKNRATIIIDPHGDMVEEIAKFKKFSPDNNLDDLVLIDPNLKPGFSPSINPFDIDDITESNIAITTQEIKRVINVLLQGASTTAQMDAILAPCIAVLLRKDGGCFEDLQRFMDDEKNADLIELGKQSPNVQHAKFFSDKFNSKGYEATKHGIYTRMQTLLNDPIFQHLISNKTTINLKDLINQRKTILFKLSLGEGGSESMEAFGRFIVGMLRILAIQRSTISKENRIPTFLYIDEFQNFISDDIEKALTQLRKYGLYLVLANQYAGQKIDTALQKALFSSGVKIIGRNESKTARSAGSEIGINPEDIQSLGIGEFFIKCGNNSALKVKSPKVLLGDSYAMNPEDWEKVVEHNLHRYYSDLSRVEKPRIRLKLSKPSEITKEDIFKPKFEL